MKLKDGENRLRILSSPLLGWEDWTAERKPVRFPYANKPDAPIVSGNKVKHFWAMIVFNYADNEIQILSITQSTIQKEIKALAKDADWGNPHAYDIKITRTGQQLETSYSVIPCPKAETTQEVQDAFLAKPVNLNALYTNDDPFDVSTEAPVNEEYVPEQSDINDEPPVI